MQLGIAYACAEYASPHTFFSLYLSFLFLCVNSVLQSDRKKILLFFKTGWLPKRISSGLGHQVQVVDPVENPPRSGDLFDFSIMATTAAESSILILRYTGRLVFIQNLVWKSGFK